MSRVNVVPFFVALLVGLAFGWVWALIVFVVLLALSAAV